jgi:hypothetical protein
VDRTDNRVSAASGNDHFRLSCDAGRRPYLQSRLSTCNSDNSCVRFRRPPLPAGAPNRCRLRPPSSRYPAPGHQRRHFFMFRSRRSELLNRLWKSRLRRSTDNDGGPWVSGVVDAPGSTSGRSGAGGSCSPRGRCWTGGCIGRRDDHLSSDDDDDSGGTMVRESEVMAFFDRLDVDQLERLAVAVSGGENGDDEDLAGECVLVTEDGPSVTVPVRVAVCRLWRWPGLAVDDGPHLKALPGCCDDIFHGVCCNPYHWSRAVYSGI